MARWTRRRPHAPAQRAIDQYRPALCLGQTVTPPCAPGSDDTSDLLARAEEATAPVRDDILRAASALATGAVSAAGQAAMPADDGANESSVGASDWSFLDDVARSLPATKPEIAKVPRRPRPRDRALRHALPPRAARPAGPGEQTGTASSLTAPGLAAACLSALSAGQVRRAYDRALATCAALAEKAPPPPPRPPRPPAPPPPPPRPTSPLPDGALTDRPPRQQRRAGTAALMAATREYRAWVDETLAAEASRRPLPHAKLQPHRAPPRPARALRA